VGAWMPTGCAKKHNLLAYCLSHQTHSHSASALTCTMSHAYAHPETLVSVSALCLVFVNTSRLICMCFVCENQLIIECCCWLSVLAHNVDYELVCRSACGSVACLTIARPALRNASRVCIQCLHESVCGPWLGVPGWHMRHGHGDADGTGVVRG
jgi:hypothetical protein